jgi:trimethylamine---corrinoid protein Co-methyltransferase
VARARITYLSASEKEFVHEKTLEVLAKVGVAYNTPRAIDLLEQAGARVDREALTARLTWDVIEPALRTVPRTVLLAGRDTSRDCVLGGGRLIATSDGMTTYMLDDVTGERREGTTADLAAVTRLCDGLDELDTLWPSPNPGDAPAEALPVITQATMVRNSTKHIQDEVRTPEMVEPILEIYEAACGAPLTERPYFSVTNCTVAPLQHDREMTEAGLKLVDRGVPIFVLPMPQAGTTGPMTLLGTCILNMAELLSGIVLYQLAHPGCAVVSGVGSAVADMRSGGYIASSPEIGLINLICLEMSRFYGLPTQATGMSADAKAADFQAGSEGGMTALTAALAGADSLISAGGIDGVQISSLAKYVLDNDQVGALRRYLREDPIDETTALMDDILEVGIGGHFLGRKSTRAHSRSEVWRPRAFRKGTFEESAGRPLAAEAAERAREIIATHEVPPLPEDAELHIDSVIATVAAQAAGA